MQSRRKSRPGPEVRPTQSLAAVTAAVTAAAVLALAACTGPDGAAPTPGASGTAGQEQASTGAEGVTEPGGSPSSDLGTERDGDPDPGAVPTLPDGELLAAAPDDLAIGMAVAGGGHHAGGGLGAGGGLDDETYAALLAANFSSVTPENQLKWEWVHPERDRYDFAAADQIVDFAHEHGLAVRGHTLLWHQQNPTWLTSATLTDNELRDVLREHVETVVGRYAGRISQWDVANEIFDDGGTLRTEENPFLARFGVDVVADVLRWAHEADPDAVLFLNDYGIEGVGAKSNAYLELAEQLLADGVPLGGMGIQGHLSTQYGKPGDMTANLARFAALGLEVAVTEADVRIPVADDGAAPADLAVQGDYYRTMVDACLEVPACGSFTVWGLSDALSWVPYTFPGEGAATLLDAELGTKPAYTVVVERLAAGR